MDLVFPLKKSYSLPSKKIRKASCGVETRVRSSSMSLPSTSSKILRDHFTSDIKHIDSFIYDVDMVDCSITSEVTSETATVDDNGLSRNKIYEVLVGNELSSIDDNVENIVESNDQQHQHDDDEESENTNHFLILQDEAASAEGYLLYKVTEIIENNPVMMTCSICFEEYSSEILYCINCDSFLCLQCLKDYVNEKIFTGIIQIPCPGDTCTKILSDQLISVYNPTNVSIYIKNKIEYEQDPNKKTCPGCHKVEILPEMTKNYKMQCGVCGTIWCFNCHAPWHWNMSCKKYQKDVEGPGKNALKYWAKSKRNRFGSTSASNARKCPSCHFYIEKITGCDHMNCSKCHTDFCYKCGKKFRKIKWLGDHYSIYSFFGCKYNLYPDKPALRISIRSACLFGGVVLFPVLTSAVIFVGILLGPCILTVKCIKHC